MIHFMVCRPSFVVVMLKSVSVHSRDHRSKACLTKLNHKTRQPWRRYLNCCFNINSGVSLELFFLSVMLTHLVCMCKWLFFIYCTIEIHKLINTLPSVWWSPRFINIGQKFGDPVPGIDVPHHFWKLKFENWPNIMYILAHIRACIGGISLKICHVMYVSWFA